MNHAAVGLVVVPCNTSHHWFDAMARRSTAPMLHIASACVEALAAPVLGRVSIFATRGAIRSGFYQRALAARGIAHTTPDADGAQHNVDDCIRAIKGGAIAAGAAVGHALANGWQLPPWHIPGGAAGSRAHAAPASAPARPARETALS